MNEPLSRGWRGPIAWYAYFLLGYLTFFFNIQGNIVPFLKDELHLSYRLVSFHSGAMAAGVLLVGLVGDRAMRALGRRNAIWVGAAGLALGVVLICAATTIWVSLPGFAVIGAFGGLIPVVVVAILAEFPARWRAVAYAELNVMAYAFAVTAPLLTGAAAALGVDWRSPLILGVIAGAIIVLAYRTLPLPDPARPVVARRVALPAAYWAYWLLLALGGSMEYAVIVWNPEFLERVVGLSRPAAATLAVSFFAAMLVGRWIGSRLVRTIPVRTFYFVALALAFAGFLVYWELQDAVAAVAGLFLLGLGIAQFYPLTASLAVGAGAVDADKASARLMTAVGLAMISTPTAMGVLADAFGLRLAHLVLPVLMAAALGTLALARLLERRALAPTPI